jgi:site-specific recombinase
VTELAPAPDALPDRAMLGAAISPDAPNHRCVQQLFWHLVSLTPGAPLAVHIEMFERLGRWVTKGAPPPSALWIGAEPPAVARLRIALTAFERFPALHMRWKDALREILAASTGVKLFAEVGLPNDRGLMQETADRLARRFLPRPPEHGQLAELFARLVRKRRDAAWIAAVPDELLVRAAGLFEDFSRPAHDWMTDAIALIATRVSALGLSEDLRGDDPTARLRDSPFFRLPRASLAELPSLLVQCRLHVDEMLHHLEHHGVSVDVVYCLEVIRLGIERIERLLAVVDPGASARDRLAAARTLFAQLAASRVEDRSLRGLLRTNLRLLARKVIERAGLTGEHYVTSSRREWWVMIASAGGGGALTAGTCAAKFLTKWGHYPLFIDGMLSAGNYAASFIVMQLCGFTLATKQPSMTAAMLAGSIREVRGPHRLDELAALIARICRSQFAAALGNILLVIPAAIAFDYLWAQHAGHSFLDPATAEKTIDSFHPFASGTIPYAALTGVLLWMSSLGAGWLENWTTYRRLPDAIRHHRAGRVIGEKNTARLAGFLDRNVAGFGGNLTLGFLLGMTPVMGVFFGLPLDVRHVTLSTGSLTLAGVAVGPAGIATASFLWAALGIVIIGLLNFGVSFVLALTVAFRARDVSRRERLALWGAVARRFVRSPLEFFFPPRGAAPSAHAHH